MCYLPSEGTHLTSLDLEDCGNEKQSQWLLPPPLNNSFGHCPLLHTALIFNPLNAELNPIRHLLALVGVRHIVHVSRIRVKWTEIRYIWLAWVCFKEKGEFLYCQVTKMHGKMEGCSIHFLTSTIDWSIRQLFTRDKVSYPRMLDGPSRACRGFGKQK